jgi:hypothetical protein
MPNRITDQQRSLIVGQYRASGLSQAAFCQQLLASEGIDLATRTLRFWCVQVQRPGSATQECIQIVAEALERLQGLLERLQSVQSQKPIADASNAAAAPAAAIEAPKAAPSPNHVEPAATQPAALRPSKAHAPIQFVPIEEPDVPEQPRRRPGRFIIDI